MRFSISPSQALDRSSSRALPSSKARALSNSLFLNCSLTCCSALLRAIACANSSSQFLMKNARHKNRDPKILPNGTSHEEHFSFCRRISSGEASHGIAGVEYRAVGLACSRTLLSLSLSVSISIHVSRSEERGPVLGGRKRYGALRAKSRLAFGDYQRFSARTRARAEETTYSLRSVPRARASP